MNVLVINCGSSSLKFQLINAETEKVLAKGLCERIGIDGRLTYQPAGGEKEKSDLAMPTHTEAIQFVIDALTNEKTGVVKSLDEIGAVGHRLVHGGEKFASSVEISSRLTYTWIRPVASCNSKNEALPIILRLIIRPAITTFRGSAVSSNRSFISAAWAFT